MSTEEVVRYLMSFLGGGVVVAIGNWIHSAYTARRQREIDRLKAQMEGLYDPVFFFTSQNQQLFELCRKIDAAYTSEIVSKNFSQDECTQASVRKDAEATTAISNRYIEKVVANNARILEILEKTWYLLDFDDIEEFSQFQIDFARFKTEVEGAMKTPHAIYQAVGSISYMRPCMIERVERKARTKTNRPRKLSS